AGCQVHAFKAPTAYELEHDFLWRTTHHLPPRGLIGVFNRSYYEEVLAVRVHPEYLRPQQLALPAGTALWQQRYQSIREHERHLCANGTTILKFWLHVSREEQRRRLLARIEEPDKNWKFDAGDLRERGYWRRYQQAYEAMINGTSTPWAPWHVIPADSKSWMRLLVARIVVNCLRGMKLGYPQLAPAQRAQLRSIRQQLQKRGG
ncbi:MAG TPA: PPK2 family polyphosphate kinase, partial [Nevskiaceae bacterium]|nr:PPK2 family polyphosphate kinase [Nevskiaceae bacterium]